MEQDKIGKFIAKCRKEKKLTQSKLAEILGVTDRAISNWENGKNLPDISLFKPLCNELDITINELLSGERLKKEEFEEKFEENIINTIEYSKKIKKKNNIITKIIITGLTIMTMIITIFIIDVRRMNNNKPVLFSTWGYDYTAAIDLHEEEIKIAIEDYLIEKNDNQSKHYNNEKWFVSLKTYLIEEKSKKLYYIYAWVLEESFYYKNDKIINDSGSSIPYKFVVELNNNKYIVTDYQIPRDGSLYKDDMKKIFPKIVRNDMEKVYNDGTIEKLQLNIQKQVSLYYHK